MFPNASGFIINQATFIENGRDALHLLSQYVAEGATHDSAAQEDAPECHPDTREQLLNDIKEWIQAPNKETGILYLHGPAGTGKSCVARSACTQSSSATTLVSSFFFWRGSDQRNNIAKLFTTIAYQLAMLNAELAGYISGVIQADPRIVKDASAKRQFKKLIFDPCCRLVASQSGRPLEGVIVIDGLDECIDKESQISVIRLMAAAVRREKFPLGFLIISRSEHHLKEVWGHKGIAPVTHFISLSDIPNASDDIRTVLQSGFSRILNDRHYKDALRSISRPWPNPRDVETLVKRSSCQFIYAATVLKFISNRSRNPDAQPQIVLGLRSSISSPLAELDALYHEIISRADDPKRTVKVLSFIFAITDAYKGLAEKGYDWRITGSLSSIIIPSHENKLFLIVEQLLSLPSGEGFFALNDLHSLIDLQESDHRLPFSFYHKSFCDFLSTKDRSKELYIDIQATHDEITQCCIKFLHLPKYDTIEQHVGWLHSYFVWYAHMRKSGRRESIHILGALQRFMHGHRYLNYSHLQGALRIFADQSSQRKLIDKTNVLTGFNPPSADVLMQIGSYLWTLKSYYFDHHIPRVEFLSFEQPFHIYKLLRTCLKSYKMDLLVKRALALHVIIPLDRLKPDLFITVPELASFPGIQKLCHLSHSELQRDTFLCSFLCGPQSFEDFRCTTVEIAQAYIDIINTTIYISLKHCRSGIYYQGRQARLWNTWTNALNDFKPAATPWLLAVLASAARDAYNQSDLNKALTHMAEVHLLAWLEGLPNRPHDLIHAWRKAFDEARHATLNHKAGYRSYFCWFITDICPTKTCPGIWDFAL